MKTLTLSEANRNFSRVTEEADKEGNVILTRHGKEAYVVMTDEEFRKREFLSDAGLSAIYQTPEEGIDLDLSLADNGVMDLELGLIEKHGESVKITELVIRDGRESFIERTLCKMANISFKEEDVAILTIPLGRGVMVDGVDALYLTPADADLLDMEVEQIERTLKEIRSLMEVYKGTPVRELKRPFRIESGRR